MNPTFISLESLQIATPCRADWNAMQPVGGQDCTRFCPSCGKNVYNLSGMTREEAERLVGGDDLCVRLRRRSDGTVITTDCPVGSASLKQRNWGVLILAAFIGSVLALLGVVADRKPEQKQVIMGSIAPVGMTSPFPATISSSDNSGGTGHF